MFKLFTKKDKRSLLEREIELVIKSMSNYPPNSAEYTAIAANLEMLYKSKANERTRRITPDTIAIIAGNLLGIALILGYEKTNIVTSKAMGFIIRGRV